MKQSRMSERQFGEAAEKYLASAVHAQGEDLDRLKEIASGMKSARALDLGCGAGHAGFALASGGMSVAACDVSEQMLEVVSREAGRRGLSIETVRCPAENTPFEDGRFDLVVTRYSAHHWFDAERGVAEAARVTKRGGKIFVIDSVSPEFPLFDTAIQTVEILRDASHVRNYRVSEWKKMLENAGFGKVEADSWKVRLDFESWIKRIGAPPERESALKAVFSALPEEAKAYFNIGPDFSFDLDVARVSAEKG